MSEQLLVFDKVVKRFGDFVAVKDMNLRSARASSSPLWGRRAAARPPPCGCLQGLNNPARGEIRLDGRVMNDVKPHERDTPMVWQSLALFPFPDARENVEFGLRMRGFDASDTARQGAVLAGPAGHVRVCRTRYLDAVRRPEAARGAGSFTGDGTADPAAGRTACRRWTPTSSSACSRSLPTCSANWASLLFTSRIRSRKLLPWPTAW